MVDSVEGLLILIVTVPGFLGYLCFSRLYERCIDDVFEKVGIVVALNVAALITARFFGDVLPANLLDAERNLTIAGTTEFVSRSLFILSSIAIIMGCVAAVFCNSTRISNMLLKLGLTRKSHSKSVLADVLRSYPDCFLKFNFKEGGYVLGHPIYYSLDGDECAIFLEKAAVRPKRSEASADRPVRRLVKGPGVMLMNFDSVQHVELL